MKVQLISLDDSAEAHQGAHLHSSTSCYIYPGCAPSHCQFVLGTTVVDTRSRPLSLFLLLRISRNPMFVSPVLHDPVILLTCSSSPLTISWSYQQPRQPALLLFSSPLTITRSYQHPRPPALLLLLSANELRSYQHSVILPVSYDH
ncbi:unnamed protein product [Pleuronectes platessa]|uniref:Uncharacterized protein n=1 Tax=Pleuronectes platessa TaxID=8262 RepID=A0A9N7YIK9_PLEPL|nr:unnamed protein product [Pleuronectes platessa]